MPGLTLMTASPTTAEIAFCLSCQTPLAGQLMCAHCGQSWPVRDGILEAIARLEGRNRTVAAFYDGPGWKRFRTWEHMFLALQGGTRRARIQILKHVLTLKHPSPCVLEVGINDGENLRFLPDHWRIHGVDIARTQLIACQNRYPKMSERLAWAEAENLPYPDHTFDASYSIGGFTYFREHSRALQEMRRVTKPNGPVVVADENPGLHRAGLGHLIGLPAYDAFWLRLLGLDRDFVDMVLHFDIDLPSLIQSNWPNAQRHSIWNRLGYCVVEPGRSLSSPAS